MPRWDFECAVCRKTYENMMFSNADAAEHAKCPKCGSPLHRKPPAANFTVKGFNAKNGYSK